MSALGEVESCRLKPALVAPSIVYVLLPTPPIAYTGLTINLANTDRAKNPLGQNAKVRHALELAIDRQSGHIVDQPAHIGGRRQP